MTGSLAMRSSSAGRAELERGEFVDISETLGQLDAVTAADITRVAARLVASPRAITVVGP